MFTVSIIKNNIWYCISTTAYCNLG